MVVFGYSPEKAEQVKDRLDDHLGKIEARIRRLTEIVPETGAVSLKGEDARDRLREMVADLQGLVDERTDREAAA